MKDSITPVQTMLDPKDFIRQVREIEAQLSSLRQQLVESAGGPAILKDSSGFGFIAIEILEGSGVIIDNQHVEQGRTTTRVNNKTPISAILSQGHVAPGNLAITIPAGESRGIRHEAGTDKVSEFVQYVWVDPPIIPGRPDIIAIGYYERYLIRRDFVNSSDAIAGGTIDLVMRPDGSFELTRT
jgi:hypothetical protein